MQRLQQVGKALGADWPYRYSVPGGCLTKEQRDFYQKNGYILVRGFLKDKDIAAWTQRFIQYCDGKAEPQIGMQIVRDISLVKQNKGKRLMGEQSITKLQDWQDDEVLFSFCTNPDILPYIQSFCGSNVKSVHTMFINKPPNMEGSSRHPLHQDLAYFPFRPADRIVAGWTALEDATQQNGALCVVPGSHKGQFLRHAYPKDTVNKAYYGIVGQENYKPEFVDMKKGDIIFFHPLLIHGSGPNNSKGYRKSICCHFADSLCKYIDVKGTYHEELGDEIISYAAKKFGLEKKELKYEDIWRRKSKLIAGRTFEDGL